MSKKLQTLANAVRKHPDGSMEYNEARIKYGAAIFQSLLKSTDARLILALKTAKAAYKLEQPHETNERVHFQVAYHLVKIFLIGAECLGAVGANAATWRGREYYELPLLHYVDQHENILKDELARVDIQTGLLY